MRKKKKKR